MVNLMRPKIEGNVVRGRKLLPRWSYCVWTSAGRALTRNIKDLEPRAHEPDSNRPRRAVPELELRQTPDERPELLILFRGQRRRPTFLELFLFQGWVEFRCQEGQ